ncbi:MAG TPA: hypothetical protein VIC26_01425 [Marinagarivorans sp.]
MFFSQKKSPEGASLLFYFALLLCGFSNISAADTFFEASISAGERQLDVFRKRAPQIEDDAIFIGVAVAAYRTLSAKAAWGGVIETLQPIGRDKDIENGDGTLLGFRPINYLYRWDNNLATELFFGAAQYDWIKKASGYYLGGNARYYFGERKRYAVALEYRYFQDLAHDGGPGGDQIVDGPGVGLLLYYRFGQ